MLANKRTAKGMSDHYSLRPHIGPVIFPLRSSNPYTSATALFHSVAK